MMTKRTARVLAEMFTENTGTHLLDSGGAYGRNWEKNQGKTVDDFLAEPVSRFVWDGETVEVSLFHFLGETLEYDPELDEDFQRFAEDSEDYWLADMEDWAGSRGGSQLRSDNIYNYDNWLDGVYQWVEFEDESTGETVVLIQIHGGCDVRGGYTRPRVFTVRSGFGEPFCADVISMELFCPDCQNAAVLEHGGGGEYQCAETYELFDVPEDMRNCPICHGSNVTPNPMLDLG